MSSAYFDEERRVVPIWRSVRSASTAGEIASTRKLSPNTLDRPASTAAQQLETDAARLLQIWKHNPNIDTAADLVGTSLLLDDCAVSYDAALYLIERSNQLAPGTLLIAEKAYSRSTENGLKLRPDKPGPRNFNAQTAETERTKTARAVSEARHYARQSPASAIAWGDLALAHAECGNPCAAHRAARTALTLAPSNRLVLRNVARMHLHFGEPDAAHHILATNRRTPHDPWLIAAEISSAQVAGRSSKLLKKAREQLHRRVWPPFHSSELASAVSTQLFSDGQHKRAQKLLRTSLSAPSENAIAQAEWLLRHNYTTTDIESLIESIRAPEASALRQKSTKDFVNALQGYAQWLDAEPYSSRPAVAGSFIGSVALADPNATIYFALRGLSANKDHWLLLNNLSVGHFLSDCPDDGFAHLRRAEIVTDAPENHTTLVATKGLGFYRLGRPDIGRSLYFDAIESFRKTGDRTSAHIAALHFVQEELRLENPAVPSQLLDAAVGTKTDSPELSNMIERIRAQYELRKAAL